MENIRDYLKDMWKLILFLIFFGMFCFSLPNTFSLLNVELEKKLNLVGKSIIINNDTITLGAYDLWDRAYMLNDNIKIKIKDISKSKWLGKIE